MAIINIPAPMLEQGTTLVFGSWICIASGTGGFDSHLADSRKPEAPASSKLDGKLPDNINSPSEMLFPDLVREVEQRTGSHPVSTLFTPQLRRLDLTRSEEEGTRLPVGLRNMATVYQEAMRSDLLLTLGEDLNRKLRLKEGVVTTRRKAPVFDKYSDSNEDAEPFLSGHQNLMITTNPQGQFLY